MVHWLDRHWESQWVFIIFFNISLFKAHIQRFSTEISKSGVSNWKYISVLSAWFLLAGPQQRTREVVGSLLQILASGKKLTTRFLNVNEEYWIRRLHSLQFIFVASDYLTWRPTSQTSRLGPYNLTKKKLPANEFESSFKNFSTVEFLHKNHLCTAHKYYQQRLAHK